MTRGWQATSVERIETRAHAGVAMQKLLPKGHVSCLSQGFRYTSAAGTDLTKTFARIRRQLKAEAKVPANVHPLRKSGQ
jgi:hypothetical protein